MATDLCVIRDADYEHIRRGNDRLAHRLTLQGQISSIALAQTISQSYPFIRII